MPRVPLGQHNFYPRPPRGGRRCLGLPVDKPHRISIHALREEGDTDDDVGCRVVEEISSHALREEGDFRAGQDPYLWYISIHALREEGDGINKLLGGNITISIHALREEGDVMGYITIYTERISIHALREEGDIRPSTAMETLPYFYPRPPRGGRLLTRYTRPK